MSADWTRSIEAARRVTHWASPPDAVLEAAETLPAEPPPSVPSGAASLAWRAADVRGHGLGAVGEARVSARAFDTGEVGILAIPPDREGNWTIRGKVWLHDEAAGNVRLVLVHEDHVVGTTTVRSGDDFVLREPVGPGWILEVHLPSGDALSLAEPEL